MMIDPLMKIAFIFTVIMITTALVLLAIDRKKPEE